MELVKGGKAIPVTESNKLDYVQRVSQCLMVNDIQKQVENFLEGFYEIIPKDIV